MESGKRKVFRTLSPQDLGEVFRKKMWKQGNRLIGCNLRGCLVWESPVGCLWVLNFIFSNLGAWLWPRFRLTCTATEVSQPSQSNGLLFQLMEHSYFTDEDTEAQSDEVTLSRPHDCCGGGCNRGHSVQPDFILHPGKTELNKRRKLAGGLPWWSGG